MIGKRAGYGAGVIATFLLILALLVWMDGVSVVCNVILIPEPEYLQPPLLNGHFKATTIWIIMMCLLSTVTTFLCESRIAPTVLLQNVQ